MDARRLVSTVVTRPQSIVGRPAVIALGPSLSAVSGVSTHINQLLGSQVARRFPIVHFQVGSQGRNEGVFKKLTRFIVSPFGLFLSVVWHRPAIVHLNTSLNFKGYWRDLVYFLVAYLMGRKVIYQVHAGALPQEFFPHQTIRAAVQRWMLRTVDVIVVLSKDEQKAYRAFVPEARIVVIPNALNVHRAPHSRTRRDALELIYLGRLVESKGLRTALEALQLLVGQERRLKLSIAGTGPEESRLKAYAAELGLQQHVCFPGPLFDEAKYAFLSKGDVFILPTWQERLPYALLEALAAGAVPVTTGVGAIPDVVQDRVHALLVPPGDAPALADAIARLDDDRAMLDRMARAGHERVVQQYNIDRFAADFSRLYESLARN
jgi:glycosyltransferase involved in cell wall biosynthesis